MFIFSPQLGSCDHVVRGVSWSGGHIVLRNWHQQGKTGYRLKEETGCHQGNVATVTSSLVCQVTTVGRFLNNMYEPLVDPSKYNGLNDLNFHVSAIPHKYQRIS